MKKYKRKVRGEVKYVLDVMHHGKRRRKYFSSFVESQSFENDELILVVTTSFLMISSK